MRKLSSSYVFDNARKLLGWSPDWDYNITKPMLADNNFEFNSPAFFKKSQFYESQRGIIEIPLKFDQYSTTDREEIVHAFETLFYYVPSHWATSVLAHDVIIPFALAEERYSEDRHDAIWEINPDVLKAIKILNQFEPEDSITRRGQNLEHEDFKLPNLPLKPGRRKRTQEEVLLANLFNEVVKEDEEETPFDTRELIRVEAEDQDVWDSEDGWGSLFRGKDLFKAGLMFQERDDEYIDTFFKLTVEYIAKLFKISTEAVIDHRLVTWASEMTRVPPIMTFPIEWGGKELPSFRDIPAFLKARREMRVLDVDDPPPPSEFEDNPRRRRRR